jgi:hypothetical protein
MMSWCSRIKRRWPEENFIKLDVIHMHYSYWKVPTHGHKGRATTSLCTLSINSLTQLRQLNEQLPSYGDDANRFRQILKKKDKDKISSIKHMGLNISLYLMCSLNAHVRGCSGTNLERHNPSRHHIFI